MKRSKSFVVIILVCFIIGGCKPPDIIYIERSPRIIPTIEHNRTIMVVGITNDDSIGLRSEVEEFVVTELTRLRYNGVSSLKQYGKGTLGSLGESQLYVKLCNDGIDVVFAIALIDSASNQKFPHETSSRFFASYYYDRIWSYNKILANINEETNGNTPVFWEGVLFDLGTLEARCIVQTRSFPISNLNKNRTELLYRMNAALIRAKILKK